ncbi:MAG: hypothetical protein ABSC48_00355 [Terracidiphilus sp.]
MEAFSAQFVAKPRKDRTHGQSRWGNYEACLRISTFFMLLFSAFFLIMPETGNAQVWVSSGFKPGADAQHETAYCSTSAIDPKTGQVSLAASDYRMLTVNCTVTASTGATFTVQTCIPTGYEIYVDPDAYEGFGANPTVFCTINFQPSPGVEYIINSFHSLLMFDTCDIDPYCWPDPEGFGIYPSPVPLPAYTTDAISVTKELTGTGIFQGWSEYNLNGGIDLATSSAQYPGCPTPTITSISPSTWLAGETYKNVIITGTNFTTKDDAAKTGCPVTPVAITAATGSVTVSDVGVDSETKIAATVKPDDDDPTEPATVTAGTAPNTGTATAQINGLPPAKIEWKGTTISGTTQPAVVGQKIELHAEPKTTPPSGYTVTTSTWQVDPTNIGSLTLPSGQNGFDTSPPALDKPNTTFYWLVPNNGLNASYTYCAKVPSGKEICPSTTKATTTFNVTGPVSPNLYACGGGRTRSGCSANDPLPSVATERDSILHLVDATKKDGITFTASDDSSSAPGKFSFVQLLDSFAMNYIYQYEKPCQSNIANSGPGLDSYYPYPAITAYSAWDSPAVPLNGDDAEVIASFQATIYLMWQSGSTSDSIPISLGSLSWGWFGDAVQNERTHDFSVKQGSGSQVNAGPLVENSEYPHWAIVYHFEQGADPSQPNYNPCVH